MNKKFTTAFIFMASLFGLQIQAQEFETATEAVKNMGVG
jgi:hypothetical protein